MVMMRTYTYAYINYNDEPNVVCGEVWWFDL